MSYLLSMDVMDWVTWSGRPLNLERVVFGDSESQMGNVVDRPQWDCVHYSS